MELAQDRDERVVGSLHGEIVEVASTTAGDRPASLDFEVGGAHEQRVQALDGLLAFGP